MTIFYWNKEKNYGFIFVNRSPQITLHIKIWIIIFNRFSQNTNFFISKSEYNIINTIIGDSILKKKVLMKFIHDLINIINKSKKKEIDYNYIIITDLTAFNIHWINPI